MSKPEFRTGQEDVSLLGDQGSVDATSELPRHLQDQSAISRGLSGSNEKKELGFGRQVGHLLSEVILQPVTYRYLFSRAARMSAT